MAWFRKPDETVTITVPQCKTADEAIIKHRRFVDLAMRHDLRVHHTSGPEIVMIGRPKKVAAFKRAFDIGRTLELI